MFCRKKASKLPLTQGLRHQPRKFAEGICKGYKKLVNINVKQLKQIAS